MANEAQLKAVITAEDKASKVIAGVGGSLDKVQSKLKSMQPAFKAMAAVGTVAFGAIAAVAFKAVKDYQEVEVANKMLEHAVVDVTHATRDQLKATMDLADALERKGVLDGDNIKVGLAQLSTFGLSNDAVRNLGGSLADLAVNQFGVSASGDQLADSANMIAKALNGQFGILEKSGIRFTDAQKHMIEFGTEMEKVKTINEGFQQNLKFTNDVALTTFAGKLAHVKVQLQNVSEAIGKPLIRALDELLKKISPVIQKYVDWTEAHPELIKNIFEIAAAVTGLVGALGGLGIGALYVVNILGDFADAFPGLAKAMGSVAGFMMGPWGIAIALVVGGLILLYQHSEGFRNIVQEVGDKVGGFLKSIFDDMVDWLKNAGQHWDDIKQKLTEFKDKVMENAAVQNILDQLRDSFERIKEAVMEHLWPALKQLWATLKENLWPELLKLWEALQPLAPYFEFMAKVVGAILIVALMILIEILTKIVIWVAKVIEWWAKSTAWIVTEGTRIIDAFVKTIGGIVDKFKEVVDWVGRAISKVGDFVEKVSKINLNPFSKDFNIPFIGPRASGGSVSPSRSFIVGENGPEIFTPQTYGNISNGAGAAIVINLTGNTFLGREGIAEQIGNEIMRALKRNVQV